MTGHMGGMFGIACAISFSLFYDPERRFLLYFRHGMEFGIQSASSSVSMLMEDLSC